MRTSATLLCLAALLLAPAPALAEDAPPTPRPTTQSALTPAERTFAKTLNNSVMVGRFTVGSRDANPKEERYTISSVRKLFGDRWLITAQIKYGGKNETLPIPLVVPVKFAGDTPVISVTDLSIPGMGTYTARVMIFRDQYAGTWDAGDHGGHLWGRIERVAETHPAEPGAAK